LKFEVCVSYLINTVAKTYRRRLARVVVAIAGAAAAAVIAPQPNSQVSAQTQTTVVLSPTDTYIGLNSNNHSTVPTIATYTWPDYQPANAILMKFDLSKLPAGAVIQSAKLRLSLVEADHKEGTPTYNVSAHKIIGGNTDLATATGYMRTATAAWTASNCCYNGIPLAQSNITPAYTTVAVDKTLGVKTWTITTMIQEWIANPSSNFGLLLNSDASVRQNRYRYFASMENSDPALRPNLEVTFAGGSSTTPSTVSVTSPTSGAVLSNTMSVTASAQNAIGIAGVQFRVNGNPLGQEVQIAPYAVNWNTTSVADGAYTLTAVARDTSGNTTTSAGVNVTVKNAATSSVIKIVPTDTSINLNTTNNSTSDLLTTYTWPEYQTANAILMRFDLSAIPTGASVQDATLTMSLVQSDSGSDPTYTITAHKILNKTPMISGATGYTYDGTNAWSASGCCYNGIPLAQADITTPYDQRAVDKTPGAKTWNLTRMVQEWVTSPSSNRGMLLNSDATKTKDRYRYFASTKNSNASLRPVLTVTLGTGSGGSSGGTFVDTLAPFVAITSPSSGATVSGTSTVSADASDNVGVVGVQFKLDGANLGSEDLTAPYSATWNTTTTANGSHTLSAVARDAAGNQATASVVTINVSNTTTPSSSSGGLSSLYPGDVGIENDPAVIFVEQFEEGSISNIVPRWGDVKNPGGMQLVTEVPPGSPAGHSLSIPWVGGGVNNGGHLYKMLNPGINDVLYVRYYIKYPTSGDYAHTGIWVGGSNPMSAWPDPIAGTKPSGNDRFIAAGEQNTITHAFEHYDYWMGMHPDAGGTYWGNFLLNNPSVQANPGQWVCVEQMVKMNNPVGAWNGEHALWLNDVKVSHLGQGFPKGYWVGGRFYQDPTVSSTFEGFQWRNDSALNINWIWLQNYAPNDPPGFSSTILFDHVVVAKSHVGCLP
jgi:Big-like domain-containing protein